MENSFRWKAKVVILIAVAVRLAFVVAVGRGMVAFEFNPDSIDLSSFAYNLSTGVGFAHAINEDRPFSQPVEFSAWRPPLYPAFLAVAFHVSRNALFLQLLQVSFAALALYFLLRLGFILFGELPALIAGLAFALYPPLIMYSADLGTESLFLLLLMVTLFVFYAVRGERSTARVFWLGVLVGLTALCRPNGLMLGPALVLAIWLTTSDWKQAIRRIALLTVVVAMVIVPWTYRNYRLFHRFVLISSNGGATLWAGAHLRLEPGATLAEVGYSQHQAHRDMTEPDREKYYYRQAFLILDHSPRRWGEMFLSNFAEMYTLVPSPLYHSLRNRVVYAVSYIPLLVSGIVGFWLLRSRWRELCLLWGWVVTNTTLYCLFLSSIRYRIPTVDPILMLGAGVCIAAMLGHAQGAISCSHDDGVSRRERGLRG
jgi:4-amino-4-deoxy-L-arabinose transferase-like glycosyltransferase